jgi:hypothetical protein
MVKLVANKSMKYGTRRLVAGDVFDCLPQHVRVLIGIRRASTYVAPPPPKRQRKQAEPVVELPEVVESAEIVEPVEIVETQTKDEV